jgi:hypothetical protein
MAEGRRSGEGGGDARSTVDNQDNTTWKEGRGITVKNVLDNRCMTELKNTSNHESVQREIERLSQMKRKDRSSLEKVRLKLLLQDRQGQPYAISVQKTGWLSAIATSSIL